MAASIHGITVRSSTLVACEALCIVGAVAASAYLRLGAEGWPQFLQESGRIRELALESVLSHGRRADQHPARSPNSVLISALS